MPSERIQRRIDQLLDEADQAVARGDWEAVRSSAKAVLAFDMTNTEAEVYLAAAEKALADSAPLPSEGPELRTVTPVSGQSPTASTSVTEGHAEPPRPAIPTSFDAGRYTVTQFLGEGGKKKMYLSRDKNHDRNVAVALIKSEVRCRRRRPSQPKPRGEPAERTDPIGSAPHVIRRFLRPLRRGFRAGRRFEVATDRSQERGIMAII